MGGEGLKVSATMVYLEVNHEIILKRLWFSANNHSTPFEYDFGELGINENNFPLTARRTSLMPHAHVPVQWKGDENDVLFTATAEIHVNSLK